MLAMRSSLKFACTVASALMLGLLVSQVSCGKDEGEGPKIRTYDEIVQAGWEAFRANRYGEARNEFDAACGMDTSRAEGYDGRAWSCALLDSLYRARTDFYTALDRDEALVDPYVGLAAVYRDMPDLEQAITNAQHALELDSDFVFEHRTSYDWRDVRLILAQCHYALADYESAYLQVKAIDPSFELDPQSEQYAELLLLKIEDLVSIYGGI